MWVNDFTVHEVKSICLPEQCMKAKNEKNGGLPSVLGFNKNSCEQTDSPIFKGFGEFLT